MTDFSELAGEKHLCLTTWRKSGQTVSTAMWFIVKDGKIYMRTGATSAKIKRLTHTPRATVAPSTPTGKPTGPPIEATAVLLPDSELEWINQAILAKYGLLKRLVDIFNRFAVRGGIAAVELTRV